MNILSTQEMQKEEQKLLNYKLAFKIHYEEPKHINQLNHHVLLPPSQQAMNSLQRTKLITRNMRALPINHSNSSLKVFAFALLSLIYQQKFRQNENTDNSTYILQSLKCSLYSGDLNLNMVSNYTKVVNSTEIKSQLAHLFAYLDKKKKQFQINKRKYLEWILFKNGFILDYLVIFLRCILSALQMQNALNWNTHLDDSQALINLFDYFDVNTRCINNIILLYEEGLLIYLLEDQILFGQYYENITDKENDEKKEQLKSSVKQNMVESFFMDNQNRAGLGRQFQHKKNGIVDTDKKLFNFLLESAEEQVNLRQSEMITPTFMANSEAFHFGQKKRQSIKPNYKPDEVRFQFQKLIMDECQQSLQYEPVQKQISDFNKKLKQEYKHNRKQQISDNQAYEDSQILKDKNIVERLKYRMSLKNQQKMNAFSHCKTVQNENISSAPELSIHNIGYNSEDNKRNVDHFQCSCFKNKLKKNKIIFKVMEIKFSPTLPFSMKEDNLINYKSQQNIGVYQHNLNNKNLHDAKSENSHKSMNFQQQFKSTNKRHIPSFLKKKQNIQNDHDGTKHLFEETKSKKSVNSEQQKMRMDQKLINKLKHQSDFIEPQPYKNNLKTVAQTMKNNYVSINNNVLYSGKDHSNKQIELSNNLLQAKLQHHNKSQQFLQFKNPKPCKIKTSTHIFERNNEQIDKKGGGNYVADTVKKQYQYNSKNSPMKFFAPVNIIAPTVYMNSNNDSNNNKVVFMLQKQNLSAYNSPIRQLTPRQHNNVGNTTYNDSKQTIKQ